MKGHRPFPPYLPLSIIIPLISPHLGSGIGFATLGRVVPCLVGSVDDYSCVRHPPGHRLSESSCERAHELGVPMRWVCRSSLRREMERCVPLCREDAHELGVSFSLRQRWNVMCP
jgi:hypothetical protein